MLCTGVFADFNSALESYQSKKYEAAYSEFYNLATIGEKRSQFNLGVMYFQGQYVEKDLVKAYGWMKLSLENADESSKNFDAFKVVANSLGERLHEGESFHSDISKKYSSDALLNNLYPVLKKNQGSRNYPKAAKFKQPEYPRKAAMSGIQGFVRFVMDVDKLGYPRNIRIKQSFPKDIFTKPSLFAIKKWRFEPILNEAGEPIYANDLDYTFEYKLKGNGIAFLGEEKFNEVKSKAEQGDYNAQFILGYWLKSFKDLGEDENPTDWFLKAAQKGHIHAQYELGRSLIRGQGCEKDKEKGLEWLVRAAANGQEDSKNFLASLALRNNDLESQKQAIAYTQDVTQLSPTSKFRLAWMYADSQFDEIRNPDKAIELVESINWKELVDPASKYEILAAAYAAKGNFEKAVEYQEEAFEEAEDYGFDIAEISSKLEAYKVKAKL